MVYVLTVTLNQGYGVEEKIERMMGVDGDYYVSRGAIRVEILITPVHARRCRVLVVLPRGSDKYLVELARRLASMYVILLRMRFKIGGYSISSQLLDAVNVLLKPLSTALGGAISMSYAYTVDGVVAIVSYINKNRR